MKIQKLYSYTRQALDDYDMIREHDKIAIGVSGGKDSLALLYALAGIRKFYPKAFEVVAITVDLGYEQFDLNEIKNVCNELDVPYYIVETQISKMVSEGQCSLCARLRKGALTNQAIALGCNKIAYAHNLDDVVETVLLSLIYEGRFSTFWPVTDMTDQEISVIRPLIYVTKEEVVGFRNKYELPVVENPCPYDHITERTYVRNLLKEINHHAPGVRKRIMTAIKNGTINEWRVKQ